MHVAVVTRKSTKDDEKVSIGRQETIGRAWAERDHPGSEVVVYADNATSGVDMERSGWQAFTAAVRSRQVSVVWAYEQSRLTRAGQATWDEVCVMLSKAGIDEIHTHRQGRISVREGNRLLGRVQALLDQEEREIIQVRVRDALQSLADEGRPVGAPGFGYRSAVDDHGRAVRVPDPVTAPIASTIVERIANGDSLGVVAKWLNEQGVPTAQGAPFWSRPSVRAVASSPRLVGLRVHRGEIVGRGTWEPIVDRAVWERAQQRLTRPPGMSLSSRRVFVLSGAMFCAKCGTAMTGNQHHGRPYYSCPHPSRGGEGCGGNSIPAEPVEDVVLAHVRAKLDDKDFVDELNRFLLDGRADTTDLQAERDNVNAKLADLAARWAADDVLEIEYLAARRVLADRLKALDSTIAANPDPAVTVDVIRAALASAVPGEIRPAIGVLVRVEVAGGRDGGRLIPPLDRLDIRTSWA